MSWRLPGWSLSSSLTPATSAARRDEEKSIARRKSLKAILHPRRTEGCARAARGMALHVHGDRVHGDVRRRGLDVHGEGGRVAAQALRTDAEHVDRRGQVALELRAFRVLAMRAERPGGGDLGEVHAEVRGAADAHADDGRRAGLAARLELAVDDEGLDGVDALGGDRH